jgi:hypothetical protein
VIIGLEKAVDVRTPIIKNLTQEARKYVNGPEQLPRSSNHLLFLSAIL